MLRFRSISCRWTIGDRTGFVNEEGPLTPDDPRFTLLFDVWLVGRSTTGLLDSVLEPAGIDAQTFAVLSLLRVAGPMTPTELARWMAAPPTTVSGFVRRLEAHRLVRKVPHPDDGRSYRIVLTPTGARAHREGARLFGPALERVEAGLVTPASRISTILLELRTALDAARPA